MESLFHLIQHEWQEISPMELAMYQLARGNTFNTRVIGLDGIKQLKEVKYILIWDNESVERHIV